MGVIQSITYKIDERFKREHKTYDYVGSEMYLMIDEHERSRVTMLQCCCRLSEAEVALYEKRYDQLLTTGIQMADVQLLAIDKDGTHVCVFPPILGMLAIDTKGESREAERRFSGIINLMRTVHDKEVVIGDICVNAMAGTELCDMF